MQVRLVIFGGDIPEQQNLCEITNNEIKFGKSLTVKRETIDIDYRVFLRFVLSSRVFWKYRMYDMNNRRRNVWLIREEDYKKLIELEAEYDN